VAFSQDLADTEKPQVIVNTPEAQDFNSTWEFDELTEEHQYTEDIDKKFKVDFKLPFQNGTSVLRFGAKYKGKSKKRDNDFYDYSPNNEDSFNNGAFSNTVVKTKDDFLAGDYAAGTFVDIKYLSGLNLDSDDLCWRSEFGRTGRKL